jgi:hypothetical protein
VLTRARLRESGHWVQAKRASEIRGLRFQPVSTASLSASTTSLVTTRYGIQTVIVILSPVANSHVGAGAYLQHSSSGTRVMRRPAFKEGRHPLAEVK